METIILAINPGKRNLGIAVLRGRELIDWKVKTFTGRWSKEKLNSILEIISQLHDYRRVTVFAMKSVDPLRASPQLIALSTHLILQARKRKVKVMEFSLDDLKQHYGIYRGRKDEIMNCIAEQYPELRKEYLKERNNLRPYYLKMFEAVAAARILADIMDRV